MLRALLRTMHLYEAHHFQTLPLRLKGTAWRADLSENNSALEIPELSSNDVAPHLDFIGPDPELGFRLSKFARPATLRLLVDLVERPPAAANRAAVGLIPVGCEDLTILEERPVGYEEVESGQ